MLRTLVCIAILLVCTRLTTAQTGTALSEAHRFLAQYEGTWTEEVNIYDNAGEPPEQATLTAVISMVLNGQFQQSIQTGELAGKSFEGWNMLGYDPGDRTFCLTVISNSNPAIQVWKGTWKEPQRTLVLEAVAEGSGAQHMQQIITFENKDNFQVTVYTVSANHTLFRSAEYKYSRQ